jgi:hypothetical protein
MIRKSVKRFSEEIMPKQKARESSEAVAALTRMVQRAKALPYDHDRVQ